jgi:VanZ family protein
MSIDIPFRRYGLQYLTDRSLLRLAARLALLACVLIISYLAFAPLPEPPGFDWDKTNHLVAFATLAALADLGWPGRAAMPWRIGLLLGYGLLIELVQGQLEYRSASVLDFAADALGIGLYFSFKHAGLALQARWRDAFSRAAAGAGRSAPADSPRSPGG